MRLTIPGIEKGKKIFTIASSPYEKDLVFVMRLRDSEFKNKMISLTIGEIIDAEGPTGHKFIIHDNKKIPAVFISGGIGITPTISMLKQIMHDRIPYRIILFYSNRKEEDISFKEEIKELENKNENLKVIFTITQDSENKSWKGERGRIDGKMIKKYVSDINLPFFYIAGPPEMVTKMKEGIEGIGVSEEHILTKKFGGY